MAKKNKAAAAAASDTGVSSPQGSGEGGGEKVGSFLLEEPTWEDAGGGRWQCAETGHELLEREKEAYARSRACRLALIDHAVAHRKPPLNAFKPHPEHKSKLICNITGDRINKSEEHIWQHINEKRFLNKLEDKMASGETAEGEDEQSNEAATKSKSNKKATVISPPLPREPKGPKPEVDDSDDQDFWVPPVGSRWDDDDGKDRWESSPGKDDVADNEDDDDSNDDMVDRMMTSRGILLQAGQSDCQYKQLGQVASLQGRKNPERTSKCWFAIWFAIYSGSYAIIVFTFLHVEERT